MVIPATKENLGELAADAKEIQRCIGRKLDVVSGGSTSSLPLVIHGGMPEGINQLRLGEALLVPYDLTGYWESPLEGLSNCCLLLDADNTLLDFDEAERKALNETFAQFELPVDAETVALFGEGKAAFLIDGSWKVGSFTRN